MKTEDDLKWYHKILIAFFGFILLGMMKAHAEKSYREKNYKKVIKQNWLGFETIEWHERD